MIDTWREEIREDQYQALKQAYVHYEPAFYGEEWW